jgi:hypothetical protein
MPAIPPLDPAVAQRSAFLNFQPLSKLVYRIGETLFLSLSLSLSIYISFISLLCSPSRSVGHADEDSKRHVGEHQSRGGPRGLCAARQPDQGQPCAVLAGLDCRSWAVVSPFLHSLCGLVTQNLFFWGLPLSLAASIAMLTFRL